MKNVFCLLVLFCSVSGFSQKKKKATSKEPAPISIVKLDNLNAEIIKNDFYLFRMDKLAKKDTMLLRTYTDKMLPTDCKIVKFSCKNIPMYNLSWTEKATTETKTKKEEIVATYSQIWNPTTKTKVFENIQTATKIKEQVFLDKLKTASETQERNRNEGYVFTLLPNGDFTLKNKSVESKYTYNVTNLAFEVISKPAPAPPVKPAPKKRR